MKRFQFTAAVLWASWLAASAAEAQTFVTPKLGGGQVTADMAHIDIYYDADAHQLDAHVDDSNGTPELRVLDADYMFDPQTKYAVLNGKAYNSQYGWNVGGFFTIPPGAAIWIELLDSSPRLETYEGWGQAGSYLPILGTAGSSRAWKWSGVMVHNTYAIRNPSTAQLFADYHVFFGDETTGARDAFAQLDDAFVHLEWTVVPIAPSITFEFGARNETNGAPLLFLNAEQFVTNSEWVVNLLPTNAVAADRLFANGLSLLVAPATPANGGPAPQHAALGACLECQFVSLSGPGGATLGVWEAGWDQPRFQMPSGEAAGTNCLRLSEGGGTPGGDPFGSMPQCRLTVNQPGLYCLGFQLLDTSTNGLNGGPIHAPSPVYCVHLQAGITLASITWQGSTTIARFGGEPGNTYYLEHAPTLGLSPPWQTVAGPVLGTNRLQKIEHSIAKGEIGFYRLRAEGP